MKTYYSKRAHEYEKVYQKPERQADLKKLQILLSEAFHNQEVLEIACGTGYWTQFLAHSANAIHGLDISPEVLDLARLKNYGQCKVHFSVQDFWTYSSKSKFAALFGGFIYSHISKEKLEEWNDLCLSWIKPGGQLLFLDNKFVVGSSTPINRLDEHGNSYQRRTLENGDQYEIIKNFPAKEEFQQLWSAKVAKVQWEELEYYWMATIKV